MGKFEEMLKQNLKGEWILLRDENMDGQADMISNTNDPATHLAMLTAVTTEICKSQGFSVDYAISTITDCIKLCYGEETPGIRANEVRIDIETLVDEDENGSEVHASVDHGDALSAERAKQLAVDALMSVAAEWAAEAQIDQAAFVLGTISHMHDHFYAKEEEEHE